MARLPIKVRKWTTTEKTPVANSRVASSATRHVETTTTTTTIIGTVSDCVAVAWRFERVVAANGDFQTCASTTNNRALLGDYHTNSIDICVRSVILLRVAFSRSCFCFDFQACNQRSERKYVQRSALKQRIVQVDFDVSASNDSYDNLFRQLMHDITTAIREQLNSNG